MDLVSPVLDVASRLWECTAKRAVYIRELPENLNSLRTAMEDLKNVYQDVEEKVKREEKHQKKRTHAVDSWMLSVEAMENEVNDLLAKGGEEIQQKFLGTCCPKNCRSSYKIGKMVVGKINDVDLKKTEGINFSVLAEPLPTPTVIDRPLDKTVGLDSLFGHVCTQLQDDKVGVVGLCGIGGVGKTTLLTRINNEFLKTRDEFVAVIWVTVSKPVNVANIQQVLLNKLEIPNEKWEGRSEDERKEEIFNALKTKKFVLLLDDIWEFIDLFAMGIPPVNDRNKSKVVFTTRFSTVCRDMGAKLIEVKSLPPNEAFALFQQYVGEDTLNSHPQILKLAEIVVKECAGLPLALKTIGRAMSRAKTPEEWDKNIQMLKKYPKKVPGMENSLFPRLALSYSSLQDDVIKSCFLYCSLFPEDYQISCNELVRLWIGEGFLDEYVDIREARKEGERIIASLSHACLLEIDELNPYSEHLSTRVKMHDVIRDMALWLSSQEGNYKNQNRFVVVDGTSELVTAQKVVKWKGTQRMSLVSPTFQEEMESLSFPNLQTLLLFIVDWKRPLSFPSGFFSHMPTITVLDLSKCSNRIDDLPTEIGKLVTLQYLNLSNTSVRKLPMELRELKKLRILILNHMKKLETAISSAEIISGLTSLQLFSVILSGKATLGDCRKLLEELEGLKRLTELSISLENSPILSVQTLCNSHKLQRCLTLLRIDDCQDMTLLHLLFPDLEEIYITNCSKLEDVIVDINLVKEVSSPLTFPKDKFLYHLSMVTIYSCESLTKLTSLIYIPNLKFLHIRSCKSLEEVVSTEVDDNECGVSEINASSNLGSLFSRLVRIVFSDLPNLRSICGWNLLFPSLKVIHVRGCPNLKKLPFHSNFKVNENFLEINGPRSWWEQLEWEDQTIEHQLTPYFKAPQMWMRAFRRQFETKNSQ